MNIGRVAVALMAGICLAAASPAAAQTVGTAPVGVVPVWDVPMSPAPRQVTHAAAADVADVRPDAVPPGVNDVACRPSAEHPNPVILAHGSDSSAYSDWAAIGPRLSDAGFCVYALNYGGAPNGTSFGTEDMYVSAGQLAEFVAQVREWTGAAKVDLVGFSQGATVARYYVNRLGGADVVDRWIGMASPTYGGVFYGVVTAADAIPGGRQLVGMLTTTAVAQQAQGSDFLNDLNAGGDTVPGVRYTTIGTRVDEMIQPYTNVWLRDPGATNIVIQDRCPQDLTGHMNMVYDEFTVGLVLEALGADGPAPACTAVPLGAGMIGMVGR